MNTNEKKLMMLLRAAVLRERAPFAVENEEGEALLALAGAHDLGHLAAEALLNGGCPPEGALGKALSSERLRAIWRTSRLIHAEGEILAALGDAGIVYMPLKGALIRAYYPATWMRTSCDLDLLLHEGDIERAIAAIEARLGLVGRPRRAYHDVSLFLEGDVHIELHFSLSENRAQMDRVLARAWDFAVPQAENPCRYHPTNEFLLFHHIAHMAYHLVKGGCGIRPILDLWLLEAQLAFDHTVLDALLAEGGLLPFAAAVRHLREVWFGSLPHTELTRRMADYILAAGVYGRVENRVAAALSEKGRFAFIRSRIFLPYRTLREYYPALKRHKILYPFFTVRRWIEVLLSRHRRRNAMDELRHGAGLSEKSLAKTRDLCRDLGLSE